MIKILFWVLWALLMCMGVCTQNNVFFIMAFIIVMRMLFIEHRD